MSEPTIYFGDITVNTINGFPYPPKNEKDFITISITGDMLIDGVYSFITNTPNSCPLLLTCYVDGKQFYPDTTLTEDNTVSINFGKNSQISKNSKIELVFINK